MDIYVLGAAVMAGFVYGITPGPGVLAVFGIGADQGRRSAASFLTGHLVGDILWLTLALVSIVGATVIGSTVFDILGLISGAYLFWLGWRAVTVRRRSEEEVSAARIRRPLLHGLTFGLTNPKSYPVAVATLTALLSAKAGLLTFAMLPALVAAISVGGLFAYVVLTGIVGISAIRRLYRRHEVWVTRLSGVMFIGFAVHAMMHAAPGLMNARKA